MRINRTFRFCLIRSVPLIWAIAASTSTIATELNQATITQLIKQSLGGIAISSSAQLRTMLDSMGNSGQIIMIRLTINR